MAIDLQKIVKGCIYLATNKSDGKKYVGKTTQGFLTRVLTHKSISENGEGSYLHRAIRAHGWESFEWSVLFEGMINEKDLFDLEKEFIEDEGSKVPNGYNLTDGGEGPSGFTHSDETRRLIGEKTKANPTLGVALVQWSRSRKGKTLEEFFGEERAKEIRLKMQIGMRGKKRTPYPRPIGQLRSEETKRKMSESQKKRRLLERTSS